jgi:DNA-binding CsgD family transcriptional regulator/tetratricopeptide (TPR) repeat protein
MASTLSPAQPRGSGLTGRRRERGLLDQLLEAVSAGESRTLVLHGEPGVGKTALLEYLAEQASDFRVARAVGIQSEMELAFAALHQLLAPTLDGGLDRLPPPQREALRTVFGLHTGPAPDRFLVGLAVLGLLAELADEQPLLCVIDDEQWLDEASAQVLGFVGRRLDAESVALVFAARSPSEHLGGLPELAVDGLGDEDARALLDSLLTAPLDARLRDQIIAETRGSPLALIELLREQTPGELAGGFGFNGSPATSRGLQERYRRRLAKLPPETQRLLRLAAADPTGDPLLVARAAERLGIASDAATAASEADLLEFGASVRFRHPLVRSAAYRSASVREREEIHRVLADVTDPKVDPDRRAWHRAQAAPRPDEDVAAELERAAERAKARGGVAAAAAFLQRAAELTVAPEHLACRALAAAQAKQLAGASGASLRLLERAESGPLSELQRAAISLIRGRIAFASNRGSEAPMLLLQAANQLEPLDTRFARETYLEALSAGTFAGRLACAGGSVLDIAVAARGAPAPVSARPPDLLLDGLAGHLTDGYAAGVPLLRRALDSFGREMSTEEELRWLWVAGISALHLWDDETWIALADRHVRLAREVGAVSEAPLALTSRLYAHLFAGELTTAASLVGEVHAATTATASTLAPYGAVGVAALCGHEAEAVSLIEAHRDQVERRGEGIGLTVIAWAKAVLCNGLGRYQTALAAAREATSYAHDTGSSHWALAELVEAAVRSGKRGAAIDAYDRLAEVTTPSGSEWALGLQARAQALVSDGEAAEPLYQEAIERLGRTRMRVDLARSQLLYGEWLRREHRRVDARAQLHPAYEQLEAIGAGAFADRAGRELLATGETVRKRRDDTRGDLTPQETQIARLARDGLTNPEIGARLFISPRTVQYHLHKVFTKLNISSRSQLDRALSDETTSSARSRSDSRRAGSTNPGN